MVSFKDSQSVNNGFVFLFICSNELQMLAVLASQPAIYNISSNSTERHSLLRDFFFGVIKKKKKATIMTNTSTVR